MPRWKNWWEKPLGAQATRAWLHGPDGKLTPLLKALIEDIDGVGGRVQEVAATAAGMQPGMQPGKLAEQVEVLSSRVRALERQRAFDVANLPSVPQAIIPLEVVIRKAVTEAIVLCEGNVALAAQALQIGAATLYRHLKDYDINPAAIRRKARKGERQDVEPLPSGHEGEVEAPGPVVPPLGGPELPDAGVQPAVEAGEQPPPDDGAERR